MLTKFCIVLKRLQFLLLIVRVQIAEIEVRRIPNPVHSSIGTNTENGTYEDGDALNKHRYTIKNKEWNWGWVLVQRQSKNGFIFMGLFSNIIISLLKSNF